MALVANIAEHFRKARPGYFLSEYFRICLALGAASGSHLSGEANRRIEELQIIVGSKAEIKLRRIHEEAPLIAVMGFATILVAPSGALDTGFTGGNTLFLGGGLAVIAVQESFS